MSARDKYDGIFPWLDESEYFKFPSANSATLDGIVASGGNLSPGMLLSAYKQGIFPWYGADEPILWWSLDPRFILLPSELHISATMRKVIKKKHFTISVDTDFAHVIRSCASVKRANQQSTWITEDMIEAYETMHCLGYAHSVEARLADDPNGNIVGGLYGLSLGSVFFGESMFSIVSDASKAAFIPFVLKLKDEGFTLIDSQMKTAHVSSLGGRLVPRVKYLQMLAEAINAPTVKGSWTERFKNLDSYAEQYFLEKAI